MSTLPTTTDWVKFQKDNPELFKTTPAQKDRNIQQENQLKALSSINIPVQETSSMPQSYGSEIVKKYRPQYAEWSSNLQNEFQKNKNQYENPVIQNLLQDGNTLNNLNLERENSASYYSNKEYNMKDLDKDEVYQTIGRRYLDAIGSDESLYENLRDAKYSIGDAVALAMKSDNWSNQVKSDYAYLKQTFDNANTESIEHILKATKDIAIDLVFDLPNLLAVPFIVSTGGVGGLALSGAAKFGATQAFRQGAKKASLEFAKNKPLRTASIGLTEGAYDAGVIGVANQVSDIQTGIRQNFSTSEAVGMTAGGAVLGGGAAYSLVKLGNFFNKRNLNKYSEESGIPKEELTDTSAQDIKKFRKGLKVTDGIIGTITGKATTPFKELAKLSPTLEELLLNVRYDAMRRVGDKGPEKIAQMNFGGAVNARQAEYVLLMQKAMSNLSGKFNKIDPQDNSDLLYLLSKNVNLDEFVRLDKVNKRGRDDYTITGELIIDGRRISDEVLKAAKGIDDAFSKIFNDGFGVERKGGGAKVFIKGGGSTVADGARFGGGSRFDLFKNISQRVANYFPRHWSIDAIKDKRDILENMLVNSKHTDMRLERMTNEGIEDLNLDDGVTRYTIDFDADGNMMKDSIAKLEPEVRQYVNVNEPTIDQKVFGNVLNPKTNKPYLEKYNGFEDMALESLKKKYKVNATSQKDLLELRPDLKAEFDLTARKFKAQVIVQDLINKANPKYKGLKQDASSLGSNLFMKERAFYDLNDLDLQKYGFVSSDVQRVITDYALSMGKNIEKASYFGRSEREFNERFIIPIMDELERKPNLKIDTSELRDNLTRLYKVTAGVDTSVPQSKAIRRFGDTVKVSQQLAHLGFATLSSLTEPFIALSRADLPDTNAFAVEFAKAGGQQIKKAFVNASDRLANLTGKKTRLFKNLDDEEFYDAYQAGVATEQSIMDRIEGMYGEGLDSGTAKKISNMFFNANLLTPWTQAVQMGAYKFGQQKVIRILGELNDNTNFYGITLSRKGKQRRIDQLAEIGLDSQQSLTEYRRFIDTDGNFDERGFRNSKFFDNQVSPSTALFSREIILNPNAAEGSKPLWMNNYWAQMLVQFAGYPTAFNNTVLKGMARSMVKDPTANVPKILGVTSLMTGAAVITNAIRSEGRSLEEDDVEVVTDAVRRWGGYGPFDYIHRYQQGAKMNSGSAALLKAPAGPIVADVVDMILYRQGIPEVVIQNLPGYSAYPKEVRQSLRKTARDLFKENKTELYELASYAVGGEVTDNNQEDVYSFLTRDENEYDSDDTTPIALHTEDTLPSLDIKDTFYIDLKGFTVADKLDAYRKSDTIGVPVYKAKGRGNVAGKIKFNKLLDLDVANAEIEAVQESITKNKDDIIYTEDFIANEIIKETNYQLTLRDDVLADDPNKTPAKENLIKKSKSFLVRNEILKLGYDAIKTKEGYTLLRENQFLPTEILDRRQQVFLGGLLKRTKGFLSALLRRAKGAANRAETKMEDIQFQTQDAVLVGGPAQAVPRTLVTDEIILPDLFRDKLRESESSGRYGITNKQGFMGAYQFGNPRLTDYKKANKQEFTNEEFLQDKKLQDEVFDWHVSDIRKGIKRNKLDQYFGQKIKGIPVTEQGMVAAAHLGGFTGMKNFITNKGENNTDKSDGITYLSDYLDKFKNTRFE